MKYVERMYYKRMYYEQEYIASIDITITISCCIYLTVCIPCTVYTVQ